MGRHPNILRPTKLTLHLREDIRAVLDLHLYSPLEKRVPKGAYQEFISERIREFFNQKTLDLSTVLPLHKGRYIIRGSEESIEALKVLLPLELE